MLEQFISVGVLMLFCAILPGPDFALVVKNTLMGSRRSGLFSALGVGCAILVHITYCILGLAIVISKSLLLFSAIKYVGAAYLVYLGIKTLLSKAPNDVVVTSQGKSAKEMSIVVAFRQGLLCNLLNPKATLFFLALFTVMIKPGTSITWEIVYAIEMFVIVTAWFCSLVLILSHPQVVALLNKANRAIEKLLGVFLIGFGVVLAFMHER